MECISTPDAHDAVNDPAFARPDSDGGTLITGAISVNTACIGSLGSRNRPHEPHPGTTRRGHPPQLTFLPDRLILPGREQYLPKREDELSCPFAKWRGTKLELDPFGRRDRSNTTRSWVGH